MAELYLDHDVSFYLAPLLNRAGHRVHTTRDQRLSAATDDVQLLVAAQRSWILVTYNRRDFALLHDAWLTWPAAFGLVLPQHHGILALDHAPVSEQSVVINSLLATTSVDSFANVFLWWHRGVGWQRRTTNNRWEPHV